MKRKRKPLGIEIGSEGNAVCSALCDTVRRHCGSGPATGKRFGGFSLSGTFRGCVGSDRGRSYVGWPTVMTNPFAKRPPFPCFEPA